MRKRRLLRIALGVACLCFPMLWLGSSGQTGVLFWTVVVPVTSITLLGFAVSQLGWP